MVDENTQNMTQTEGEVEQIKPDVPPKDEVSIDVVSWQPKTELGRLVKASFLEELPPDQRITTMEQALATGLPLREPEIVDILLPNLEEEVIDVNMVQRMTDSGRRLKFSVTVVVGNGDGFVGIGRAKAKEVGPAIRKATDVAKLNIIPIRRGCGSWECGCGQPHSLPFAVKGKGGSVEVTLKPAPRGIGLATADVAKMVLRLAGVKDAWSFSRGKTKTTVNFAYAVFDALRNTMKMRVTDHQEKELNIKTGSVGV